MFDLEKSISDWRKQMLAAGVETPVPLDELEAHLRDEVAQRIKSGTDAQTAFDAAVKKIGNAPDLKTEFAKVHRTPAARKFITFYVPLIVLSFSLILTTCVLLKAGVFSQMNPRQQLSCHLASAALSILGWTGVFAHRLFPVVRARRTRDIVYGFSGVLLAIWWIVLFYRVLPGGDFDMLHLIIALFLGYLTPYGIFAGFMAGIEKAALRRTEN